MQPASCRTGCFRDRCCESEDVVTGVTFNLVDSFYGEAGTLAKFCGGFRRDNAGGSEDIGSSEFYAEQLRNLLSSDQISAIWGRVVASDHGELLHICNASLV